LTKTPSKSGKTKKRGPAKKVTPAEPPKPENEAPASVPPGFVALEARTQAAGFGLSSLTTLGAAAKTEAEPFGAPARLTRWRSPSVPDDIETLGATVGQMSFRQNHVLTLNSIPTGTAPTAGTAPIAVAPDLTAVGGALLEGQLSNLPAQVFAAAQFSESGAAPIDIVRDPASSDPSEAEDQREHYAEARRKALDLQALGGNFLGDDLQRRVAGLLEVMSDDMGTLSIVRLWHRANSLRERLADHDQALERQGPSGEPDPAILAYAAAGPLRDFVKSYNIFIIGDAKGRELDRKSLGPGERERGEAAIAAMEPVISALRSMPDVATEAVPEILQEQSDAAKAAPKSLAGDQDVALARDSIWNFIRTAIRFAFRGMKDEVGVVTSTGVREKVYAGVILGALGAPAYWSAVANFIAERADAIKAFALLVYNNPSIPQMIDAIANHLLRGHI
jgi:hypothetical protein